MIVAAPERAAEKLRAFLTITRDKKIFNDAYDLYYFDAHVLTPADWSLLPTIVAAKLNSPGCIIPKESDLVRLFDDQIERVAAGWGTASTVVAVEPLPEWATLAPRVQRFQSVLPLRKG